jgi:hypothetical protein
LSCDADETAVGGAQSCEPGVEQACYEGPEGTQDVGACRAGVRTCLPHGRGFGPCEDAVTPDAEDCSTDEDENCDGISTCGDTLWSSRLGADNDETVLDIDSDLEGNLFATGSYRVPFDLGGGPLTISGDSRDVFVAKRAPDGAHVWNVGIHSSENLTARAVAVSSDGRIAAGFGGRAAITIDGGPAISSAGGNDVALVWLDAQGTPVRAAVYGDDAEQQPMSMAFDDSGDLIVTGTFRGSIDFGLGEHSAFDTQSDTFVVKLGQEGEPLWSTSFYGSDDDIPRALGVDRDHGIFVAGEAQYDLTIGDHETIGGPDRDAYLVKLDASGEVSWSHRWGDERDQEAYGLAVDDLGNVVVVGGMAGRMTVGAIELVSPGGDGVFIVKLDGEGVVSWARVLGGGATQRGYDVTFDSKRRIIVTGYYEGYMSIDEAPLPESGIGSPSMFVVKLEPDGKVLWSRGFSVQGDQATGGAALGWRGLALAPDDRLWFAGFVDGPLDLGEGPLEPLGGTDVILALLSP